MTRAGLTLAAILGFGFVAGCSTLPADRQWGADFNPAPGWQRAGTAAKAALTQPGVWVPLAGAAAFQVDDWDRHASDWAREHTPVFGSEQNARDWSDGLRDSAGFALLASVAAAESGGPDEWPANKARGSFVDVAAIAATSLTTGAMKSGFDRERPNGADRRSFPSGHSSSAAVYSTLASRNLRFAPIAPLARTACGAGLDLMAAGTAWARVEAGWHYPSDVLFGMALGRFFGAWLDEMFLAPDPGTWTVEIYPVLGNAELRRRSG